MNVFDDLGPYTTLSGLVDFDVLPEPKPWDRGDNGSCGLAESICIATMQGNDEGDRFERVMAPYIIEPGLMVRRKDCTDVNSPDNYIALLAAAYLSNRPKFARDFLLHGLKHFGFYTIPGNFQWEGFLWRMPHLIYMGVLASRFPNWLRSLKYLALSALAFPGSLKLLALLPWLLPLYSALCVFYEAKIRKLDGGMDPWRLTWLTVQVLKGSSICSYPIKLWYSRLRKEFPLDKWGQSMRGVAANYYCEGHPFSRHWVD